MQLLLSFRLPTEGRSSSTAYRRPGSTAASSAKTSAASCRRPPSVPAPSGTTSRWAAPARTEAEILEAADIAQLTPFLSSLPERLEHPLQQSGKNLSGGQKQRLCIARAILKDAPIYVFDDSFSALDFLTEANLRRSLNEKIQGKTQIVITQRITSAMNADHIFVMDSRAAGRRRRARGALVPL
ncbi:MAG: ATP-binding cassette domain-containing protein [Oscillospiraceae bacterium]